MKKQYSRVTRCWLSVMVGLGICGAIALPPNAAIAQVVADPSLGTTVKPFNAQIDLIKNGTRPANGANLFHSFQQFSIGQNRAAYFIVPDANIQNILARVTGGNPSQIFGVLGTRQQLANGSFISTNANLFLMNPNGIIFGANASLDVGGSFVATTANAIQFPGGAAFSVISPVDPQNPLLAVNPSAFLFSQINHGASIQSNSNSLGVPAGKSLLFLGGDILLDQSSLYVYYPTGGRIELGGLAAPGKVDLGVSGDIFRLKFPANVARSNVTLINQSSVDATAGNGGSIAINAQNLTLQSSSHLYAGINGGYGSVNSNAGDIDINATGNVIVEGSSGIANTIYPSNIGNSGNVNIQTQKLIVRDSQISASVLGSGSAGDLTVHASESVELSGFDPNIGGSRNYPGGLFAQVDVDGTGQGGNLTVVTKRLSVSDGSKVQVATFGNGNAGNLIIQADEVNVINTPKPHSYSTQINAGVSIDPSSTKLPKGNGGNLTIKTKLLNVVGTNAEVAADTFGNGNAGNLDIDTEQLVVTGGGSISASTYSFGNAGNMIVRASDSIMLDGDSGRNGGPGGLLAQVNPGASGHGGNLTVETGRLSISNGSKVQAATFGDGDAGNLSIKASEIELFNTPGVAHFFSTSINAGVTRDPRFPGILKGNGGDLTIETGRLSVRGGEVSVDTDGIGNAGRLSVQSRDLVEVVGQGSFLTADVNSSGTGQGGNLTVETQKLSVRDGGQVGASTFGVGNAGNLTIRASNVELIGAAANGNPSGLFSTVSRSAQGNGGNVTLNADNLSLRDGAILTSRSRGEGNAGSITANIRGTLQADNGTISTTAEKSSGGAINISAENIRLRGNSDIRTDVANGAGGGGDITLTANSIVALNDSDILAFARDGKGGNITFNTRAFFGQNYRPAPPGTDPSTLDGNNRVDVNASGAVSGIITLPDVSYIQNSLTEFPQTFTDTTQLLANSCIVRRGRQSGSFTVTGAGGLPQRPGDAGVSPFPTGTVRSLPTPNRQTETTTPSLKNRSWQIGAPVVEPQGVYQLANGQLVMSRECH